MQTSVSEVRHTDADNFESSDSLQSASVGLSTGQDCAQLQTVLENSPDNFRAPDPEHAELPPSSKETDKILKTVYLLSRNAPWANHLNVQDVSSKTILPVYQEAQIP